MKQLYKGGRLAIGGLIKTRDFVVKDGKFFSIEATIECDNCEVVQLDGLLVMPGLVDIHTHGVLGIDFNLFAKADFSRVISFYHRFGVTSLFPTLVSDSFSHTINQISIISELKSLYPEIKGIHLEGPYISKHFKGAISETYLKNPDISETKDFIKAAQGLHLHMTLSPELDNACNFIKAFASDNISFSLGHSGASYIQTKAAVEAGAKCFTHAFNAMKAFNHHDPGIVGYMLESDSYLELISDGHHLSKDTIKLISTIKNPEKLILVTDSIMATGLENGEYYLGEAKITVKNNQAMLSGKKVRAGSTLTGFDAVNYYSRFTGVSMEEAWNLMSKNPAKMLDMEKSFGRIAKGLDADFIILDDWNIKSVFVQGKLRI